MRLPEGLTSISVRGVELPVDASGVVQVPSDAAEELMHHGLELVEDGEPAEAPKRKRG